MPAFGAGSSSSPHAPTPSNIEEGRPTATPTSFLPQPATEADRTGRNRLIGPDTVGIYLIRPCCFRPVRAANPGYRLGWARSPPFPTHTDHPTTPLLRRRLHRFSAPGTTHKAFRLPTGPQHLRRAYFDPHLRRRTASVPRESRRGHRRSSWLGFQAVRRLPAIHHWRHDPSPFGSDLFSDTSPRRRRCGNCLLYTSPSPRD